MLEAAETLEKDCSRKYVDRIRALEKENKEASDQIKGLEEENKRLLDTLVRHSKNKALGDAQRSLSSSNMGMSLKLQNQMLPHSFQNTQPLGNSHP